MVLGQLHSHTQPHCVGEVIGRQKWPEGMKNGTTAMEGHSAISNERICTITTQPSSPTSRNLL